jgi:hypothetical protein
MTRNYWLSWYHDIDALGAFELHSPWWVSGTRLDGADTVCAAIKAENEDAAKAAVVAAYDTPPDTLEWRFCERQPDVWSPFNTRFQRSAWIQWETTP